MHYASELLTPGSAKMCRLTAPVDFVSRGVVNYTTSDAVYSMDYRSGAPVLSSRPLATLQAASKQ
jgi:hypothetical protein